MSPEERTLGRILSGAPMDARDRIDWKALVRRAIAERVAPLLFTRLSRDERLPATEREALRSELYRAEAHGGRTVVFGHWAAQGLIVRPHLRGLDTGCVWGKELTAWIAEEDRLVSVRARRAYASFD